MCEIMCGAERGQRRETGCGLCWKPQVLEFLGLHLAFHVMKKVCQLRRTETILFNSFQLD